MFIRIFSFFLSILPGGVSFEPFEETVIKEEMIIEGVETALPSRRSADVSDSRSLSGRRDLLPYDRTDVDVYIAIPAYGIAFPVQTPKNEEKEEILLADMTHADTYLVSGALHQPGTSGPWEGDGNYVVAGHSSYRTESPGYYKTIMAVLPLLKSGDQIKLYHKAKAKTENREIYNYIVHDSFETTPLHTQILLPHKYMQELTLYGCYPIGSREKRWVVKATKVKLL